MDLYISTTVIVDIELPKKIAKVFAPARGEVLYRVLRGGRGSGKSYGAALVAALFGYVEPLRILCTREYQNSIKESFYAELVNAIKEYPFLQQNYKITNEAITGVNGTEFIFKGLRNNIDSIKSLAQVDICIVEEAETVPEYSWVALEPTIRAPKSEIWVIYNPKKEGSPVDTRFVKNTPRKCVIETVNYSDNPFFPDVLEERRKMDLERMDYATYLHIWEGDYLKNSEQQVFANKWKVQEFTPQPEWAGAYFGADFGFAQDPSTLVKCWINDGYLYIEKEAGGVGIETMELPALYRNLTDGKPWAIYCDSARPETISYLRSQLINAKPAIKGAGSVEDGIQHMRSYKKIIIHPQCKNTINEFNLYSYKLDRLTGEILPIIVDAHNHYIDAVRYSLNPLIKGKGNSIFSMKR